MIRRLKRNVRAARQAFRAVCDNGYSPWSAALLHLPVAALVRAYRVAARRVNASGPVNWVNSRRIRDLDSGLTGVATTFYVIVVPGMLHLLVPCLRLIPERVNIVLVINGAGTWEIKYLARRFPRFRVCKWFTLPNSSLSHGDAITVLLKSASHNFGILDHDLYVFDDRLFDHLEPGPGCYVTAVAGETSTTTGVSYPHTWFLYFDTAIMRHLMDTYGVDARIYRRAPAHLTEVLRSRGFNRRSYLKPHHQFFDTLTLLWILASAEHLQCRFFQAISEESVWHLGSTSSGITKTKPLLETYIHLRFLETFADDILMRRYARRFAPVSAEQIRARIPLTPEHFAKITIFDSLIERLANRLSPLR